MTAKFVPIVWRSVNGYDTKVASDEAARHTEKPGESLTVQSMSEDADINVLMKRFGVTGKMPDFPYIPISGDFTHVTDFQSAIEAVRSASEGFMTLPADVRARFENNPQKMLEFLDDSRNVDDAIKLGLLNEGMMRKREEYWKKDKEAKHAALLEAAHAAGLQFVSKSDKSTAEPSTKILAPS